MINTYFYLKYPYYYFFQQHVLNFNILIYTVPSCHQAVASTGFSDPQRDPGKFTSNSFLLPLITVMMRIRTLDSCKEFLAFTYVAPVGESLFANCYSRNLQEPQHSRGIHSLTSFS